MAKRSRRRHAEIAAAASVALVLVPLLAAGCGNGAGEEGASQTPTVTEAVDETTTEIGADEGDATRAASPPSASPGPVVRFAGSGDRVLPPVEVRSGGAALRWRNRDEVFSVFYQDGMLIDSVERSGGTVVPAGRYEFSVVASGGWTIELQNARRAR